MATRNRLAQIMQAESIEGIIHFAAFKAVGESVEQPLKYYDNNVATFVALLHAAVAHGISRFVFSSTAAVYGNAPEQVVTEDTPCNPESPYGWSKRMDEIILRDTCRANPTLQGTALRYFNVVGAHDSGVIGELPKGKPQNLLPIAIEAVNHKVPLTVYGTDYRTPDGTCLRDYIHVTDLAKAHVAALQRKGASYDVYNIGTGKPTSVLELLKTFEKVNGIPVPYTLGERRPGDPTALYAAADKALNELGWQAKKTIEDACRDAWQFRRTLL